MSIEEFHGLLRTLTSSDNNARQAAEATYNSTKEAQPVTVLTFLAQTIQCPDEALRAFAAVLFRRSCPELWRNPAVDAATKATIKQLLIDTIRQEQVKHILNKVSDTISSLALVIFNQEGGEQWDELLPSLMQFTQSESPLHRESALNVFSQLATYLGKLLIPHQASLKQIFLSCLSDASNGAVRLAALKAVCNFIPTVEDTGNFADLLAPMVQVISTALSEGDEDRARSGCEHVIELIDLDVKFLRSQIAAIADLMLQICNTDQLDDSTRQLGMEFLVATAEKSPGLARKMNLVNQVFPMALNFMLTIEDDEEWEGHDDDNEDEEYSNYDVGEEALDRLAMAVGGKTVLPVANTFLQQFLSNADWRYRHAGLMAVSQIGEGCAKQIKQSLGDVINMVLANFQDPHPRVKWAAINTVGQMATDFGPDLQNDHHEVVLTALLFAMEDGSARVQSHAAAAVINFCEHAEAEVMEPYLDPLLQKLFILLKHTRKIVLEQAITAVASVADSAEVNFGKYYDMFMPFLKDVLAKAEGKEYRMMRGKAMECISLIGLAVGKEKFAPDAVQVMEVLMAAQQAEMEPDDPQISYMLQAWTRICKCLGRDFVPYLPYVMPPLLRSAEIQPEVQVADADDLDELEGMETVSIGDKTIGIRTSGLEEKATACNMMACFLAELGEGFHEYIQPTATIMVPLLQFYYHDEVRGAAVSCMPELIKCTVAFVKHHPEAAGAAQEMSSKIVDQLVESIIREPEVEIQIAMLDALQESVEAAGEANVGTAVFAPFVDLIPKLWEEIEQRNLDRTEAAQNEDFDEEEHEVMLQEGETDQEMQEMIVQCMGGFFKTFGPKFLALFQETPLAQHYLAWLGSEVAVHRRIALCVFCDIAEHCGDAAAPLAQHFLPSMLVNSDPGQTPEVRQAAVYGLGACADNCQEAFRTAAPSALEKLVGVVAHPEARSVDNEAATDNAVSALGKVCKGFGDLPNVPAALAVWLNYLPLKSDLEEAVVVNEQLCELLERNMTMVLGANNERLSKVCEAMAFALGTPAATSATQARMGQFLGQLKAQLPAEQLVQLVSSIDQTQQQKLQSALEQIPS